MKKSIIAFIVVLLCSTAGAEDNFFEARIDTVLAANKLILKGGTVVELAGIVMPGVRDGRAALQTLAITAKNDVEKMLDGKVVRFEFIENDVDTGQKQAYVFCSGIFLNAYLVKKGFALVDDALTEADTYASYLQQIQAQAVAAKKGVWAYALS